MIKKIITIIVLSLCLSIGIPYINGVTQAKAATSDEVTDLQKYLEKNFGTLRTKIETFDLSGCILVIENHNSDKCYDIAVIVDWMAIEEADDMIQTSTKYTKTQKKSFNKSLKSYQQKMAEAIMEMFPDKKIRGGFLIHDFDYLSDEYYESTVYGWKTYDYINDATNPVYADTAAGEFSWYNFDTVDEPFDEIGLH
jgi:hypothetical protein